MGLKPRYLSLARPTMTMCICPRVTSTRSRPRSRSSLTSTTRLSTRAQFPLSSHGVRSQLISKNNKKNNVLTSNCLKKSRRSGKKSRKPLTLARTTKTMATLTAMTHMTLQSRLPSKNDVKSAPLQLLTESTCIFARPSKKTRCFSRTRSSR